MISRKPELSFKNEGELIMRKNRKSVVIAGLTAATIITASMLSGCGTTSVPAGAIQTEGTVEVSSSTKSDSTVMVSSIGKITVIPDMAELTFGVDTEDTDVEYAQEKNSRETEKVIEKLKDLGIDEKSIKTSGYDIYTQYDYDDDGKSRVSGYTVSTMLTVSDIKVEDAGHIISQCVKAGINSMNGISYSCSGYDEAYKEALAKAVKGASEKAEVLAEASGKKLGDVVTIVEGYQNTDLEYRYLDAEALKNSYEAADAVVMPGESDIEADITVTYGMN